MRSKKGLVIAIIVILILVLAIAGAVFGYLYVKTDTFRSDKKLFLKYVSQNIDYFSKFSDSQILEKYSKINEQEKYEANTKIKTTYSEGGEVSNKINNLSAVINVQKDDNEKYFYADGQVLAENQKYLESEIIKDQDLYGVRFTDVVKQFITIKNDENLEAVAKDLGTDSETLQKIMDAIDGSTSVGEEILSEEDTKNIKEKYSKLIIDTVSSGTFGSNKKAQITYNNSTIMTKSYTVSLTSEQVENLFIQILNNLKTEDAIISKIKESEKYKNIIDQQIKSWTEEKDVPAIKMTVYEQKGTTIRTVLEMAGMDKIVIENTETDGIVKTNIQLSAISAEKTEQYNIELSKKNIEQEEEINLEVEVINGDDKYNVSFLNDAKFTDASMELNSSINYQKDILTASLVIENNVSLGSGFDKKQTISEQNKFVLNDAESETRKNIIGQLKARVPEKANTRIGLLKEAIGLGSGDEEQEVPESSMTQIDINKFNAKFEFYTGDEVSAENVKALLGIVKDHLGSYEINTINDSEDGELTDPSKIQYSMKLKIERNKKDENGANQVIEKINDEKKYKISIFYKEQNKLIDYITIDEVEK